MKPNHTFFQQLIAEGAKKIIGYQIFQLKEEKKQKTIRKKIDTEIKLIEENGEKFREILSQLVKEKLKNQNLTLDSLLELIDKHIDNPKVLKILLEAYKKELKKSLINVSDLEEIESLLNKDEIEI